MKGLLLKNCIVFDMNKKMDILIEEGKISHIAPSISEKDFDLDVMDIRENYVLPGLIDCHTHLGIIEEATGKIGIDNNETSDPVTPHLRGLDAINPFDIAFGDAVRSGITTVMSGPGSNNAVGGHNLAMKTHGKIIDKMLVKSPVGFKIALGENPISTYGKNDKSPVTRMGIAALIRELFMRTQDYMAQKEQGSLKERNIQLEAVIPLLKGEIPLRAHAHRADDIATAIRIADEFNIKMLVVEHGTEANLIKDYIKEKNVYIAYGPMLTPRTKMELKRRNYDSVLELSTYGVKTALMTDHPYNSIDQLRAVTILAISEGLSVETAYKCLTIHPAEILMCEDRIGKLSIGYDADITVFDGFPFDINAKVIYTLINGVPVYKREDYGEYSP